jgi:hypothetical protein
MTSKEPKAAGSAGVKVVLVGDSNVGKSSFLYSYKANQFPSDEEVPAILDSFKDLVVTEAGNEVTVEMWDVGGADNYRVLRPMVYRDAHVRFAIGYLPDRPLHVSELWLRSVSASRVHAVHRHVLRNRPPAFAAEPAG